MTLKFSEQLFEKTNTQISNFAKIRPVRAILLHADGRIDRHDEANSRFSAILRTRLKTPRHISAQVAQIEFLNDLHQRSPMLCAKAVGVRFYGLRNGPDFWDVRIIIELYINTRVTL